MRRNRSEYYKTWYEANREKKREYNRQWLFRHRYVRANRLLRLKEASLIGSHTQTEWEELKAIYNYTCPKCLTPEPTIKLTRDHKIPVIKGGSNSIDNIQPLCLPCNARKGKKIWFASCPLAQPA